MDRAVRLMRCLSFFLARWGVSLVYKHTPGAPGSDTRCDRKQLLDRDVDTIPAILKAPMKPTAA